MDYMDKLYLRRAIKGYNEQIRWAKREIRRLHGNVEQQARMQKYRHLMGLEARELHLKLAYLNGTPYAHAERSVKKPVPSFSDEERWKLHAWVTGEKIETHSAPTEYFYSMVG